MDRGRFLTFSDVLLSKCGKTFSTSMVILHGENVKTIRHTPQIFGHFAPLHPIAPRQA